MSGYEYKVVPAPAKGLKVKGLKTPEARFAGSVETVLNEMGAQGWEYLRAELLPSDERTGLTGTTTNWRNVLVFRRARAAEAAAFQPRVLEMPVVGAAGAAAAMAAEPRLVGSALPESQDTNDLEADDQPDVNTVPSALTSRARQRFEDSETTPEDAATGGEDDPDAGLTGIERVMRHGAIMPGDEGRVRKVE